VVDVEMKPFDQRFYLYLFSSRYVSWSNLTKIHGSKPLKLLKVVDKVFELKSFYLKTLHNIFFSQIIYAPKIQEVAYIPLYIFLEEGNKTLEIGFGWK
jgi:hypothetical protein